ncbi:MAG: tetratricopeptide repeat protein [Flavobacteriales bacterium]|nr:tetratricopeptide repeat protein [Flavobacteriales bacterium]
MTDRSFLQLSFALFVLASCNAEHAPEQEFVPIPQSLEELDRRILATPSDPALFAQRARFHESRDSVRAALNDWARAIQLDSTSAQWHLGLGDLYYRKIDLPRAEAEFTKAARLAPDSTEARLKLAELQLVQREYAEAMRWANDALRLDDQNARAYFLKGWIHREAGDTSLAISSYRTALERDPGFYDAYIALGLIFAQRNDPLAMQYYNSAVDLRPESVEAWYDRGMFAQENGLDSVALASYDRIKLIDPRNATAWYNSGYILLEHQQRTAEARAEFSRAIAELPTYAQAYYNRGLTYELEGTLDSALLDYKRSLALAPDMDFAAQGLGRLQQMGIKVR